MNIKIKVIFYIAMRFSVSQSSMKVMDSQIIKDLEF